MRAFAVGCVQAWRMTRRDWRAGELNLLLLAMVVAVAALTSVSFLSDRMGGALARDARQLLGADLVVAGDAPLDRAFAARASGSGLQAAVTAAFPSMAVAGERNQLVAVKAVSRGYPLRGTLRIASAIEAADAATREVPSPAGVWVDAAVLQRLGLNVGDTLQLGNASLRIEAVLTQEMDRGAAFMNFAPRVMLNLDTLPQTGLVTTGSRVTWKLLVAGSDREVASYRDWAEAQVADRRGMRIETLDGGQPEMRATLDRAERFLSLVALLTAMVAAVAIAMSARRFVQRHLDACAVSKCLGQTHGEQLRAFLLEYLLIGVLASVCGSLLGFAGHFALLHAVGELLAADLPAASARPWGIGIGCGLVLLFGFAVPPLLGLAKVSPLRVLRRELGAPDALSYLAYLAGLSAFVALLLWTARDLLLGALTAGGFLLATGLFAVITWLAIRLGGWLGMRLALGVGWRTALLSVQRRAGLTVLQTVALAIGLMALLLLAITRDDLVRSWRDATPADAPNRFIINIQPDQKQPLVDHLLGGGVKEVQSYPMIRARLTRINARAVSPDDYSSDRARRLVDREFNLSYGDGLPRANRIVAGEWFGESVEPQVSVEEGIARALALKVGDRLEFDVSGQTLQAPITSLRKLDWGSMNVNFFMMLPREALKDYPQTWVMAFGLPGAAQALEGQAVARFAGITVVNTELVARQVQGVLDKVVAAIEFMFVFTLMAGAVVLVAALSASRDQRARDAALMRALGASGRQLRQMQMTELWLVGLLAGGLAAAGAMGAGWVLSSHAFEFPFRPNWLTLPIGLAVGALAALASGWFGLRGVLGRPAATALRETA